MPWGRWSVVLPLAAIASVFCFRAEIDAGWTVARALIDVGAGLAICIAGCLDRQKQRGILLVLTGCAWFVGGVVPELANLHRGVLALALMGYPPAPPSSTSPANLGRWVGPLLIAVPLALNGVGPLAAAALFACGILFTQGSRIPMAACAALEALVALAALVGPVNFAPVIYSIGVAGIALATVLAHRQVLRDVSTETARAAGASDADVHARLTELLRNTLRDRTLTVTPFADSGEGRKVLVGTQPWAQVVSDAPWIHDQQTWLAVRDSIALVGRQQLLIEAEHQRAAELVRSRNRLLDTADDERTRIGLKVVREVVEPLRSTATILDSPATQELAGAAVDTEQLLGGIAPVALGDGALADALTSLVDRWPTKVNLQVDLRAPTDAVAEAVVYAICAEGLSNQAKHAPGADIRVHVWTDEDQLEVTVTDDGQGGADPTGSGLRGLADRVSARGGGFEVVTPTRGGTELRASLPRVQRTGA